MDTKKIIVTLPVSIYNYALRQGKNLNEGIINIIKSYRELDAENITASESVMDEIADVEIERPVLPTSVLSALDSINSEVEDSAVESGKVFRETTNEAVWMEYSPYSYAIVGDTKPIERRDIIKSVEGSRYVGSLAKYHNASGWVIAKRSLPTDEDCRNFLARLEKTGLEITIGESVATAEELEEAKAKAKPKTKKVEATKPKETAKSETKQKEPKVVTLKKKVTPKSVCFEPAPKGSDKTHIEMERDLSVMSGGLYYSYDKEKNGSRIYFCVGRDEEMERDVYCMLSACKGDATTVELPKRELFDYIRKNGAYMAYKDGKLSQIPQHMIWAYAEIGDIETVKLMEAI